MVRVNKGILALGLLVALSWLAVIGRSVWLSVLFVLAHFLVLKFTPIFKGRESIWMFAIVAFSFVPFNIYALVLMNRWELLFDSLFLLGILRSILYYTVFFCIEEILMGVVTAFFWRKQFKNLP